MCATPSRAHVRVVRCALCATAGHFQGVLPWATCEEVLPDLCADIVGPFPGILSHPLPLFLPLFLPYVRATPPVLNRRGAKECIIKLCPMAAQLCCTFRPTSFSSVQNPLLIASPCVHSRTVSLQTVRGRMRAAMHADCGCVCCLLW